MPSVYSNSFGNSWNLRSVTGFGAPLVLPFYFSYYDSSYYFFDFSLGFDYSSFFLFLFAFDHLHFHLKIDETYQNEFVFLRRLSAVCDGVAATLLTISFTLATGLEASFSLAF